MTQFTSRRSIRRYTQQPIDEALLHRLLSDAERTQTMGNLQLYSVVVTRSDEMKQRLAPAHFSQPMVTGAPVVLTFCADYRRTTLWAEQRQGHPGYDNLLSFINAATDALLYCQTFCNMAEAEGLGLCFLGTTVYCPEAIIDTLQLPPLVFPVATITLGWPDEHPAQTDRLPLSAIVHEETYADYTPERRLCREGSHRGEPPFRGSQQRADPCPDIHRHPLHTQGQRGHLCHAHQGAAPTGISRRQPAITQTQHPTPQDTGKPLSTETCPCLLL